MSLQATSERFMLTDWARLEGYHPAVRLMAEWAWSRPACGEPPLSPGGFADFIGVSRRVVTRWLQAPVTGPLPLFTLQVARQVARATGLPLDQVLLASEISSAADPLFDARGAWAYVIAQVERVERQGPREPGSPDDRGAPGRHRQVDTQQSAVENDADAPADAGTSSGGDAVAMSDRVTPPTADSSTAQWAADLAAGVVTLRDLCVWYLRAVAPADQVS